MKKNSNKNIPIYIYYMTIEKQKSSKDSSSYDMQEIINALAKVLDFTQKQELTERKTDNPANEKIIVI